MEIHAALLCEILNGSTMKIRFVKLNRNTN